MSVSSKIKGFLSSYWRSVQDMEGYTGQELADRFWVYTGGAVASLGMGVAFAYAASEFSTADFGDSEETLTRLVNYAGYYFAFAAPVLFTCAGYFGRETFISSQALNERQAALQTMDARNG